MLLKAIGILLLISAIAAARNVASDEYSDDSGEYDEYTDLLLKNVEAGGESGEKKGYKVCQTDNCEIIAKELKGGMNTSVDPCNNFYDYVCGAWNDRLNLIPPYERSWGLVELFQHTVYKRIRDILETDPEPTDILPVRQAKIWYAACMNEEERKKRGIKPIESILMQTGGWPMVLNPDEWFEDDFSWQELEKSYFYVTGDLVFYNIRPSWSANENGTASHIEIRDAVSPLGQRMHYGIADKEAEEKWKKYKPFVKRVAKEFIKHNKAEVPEEVIDNDIDDLIEFERKLYNFGNMHEPSLLTTIGDFVDEYHENVTDISGDNTVHFEQLFSAIFSMVGFKVDRDQELEVERPHFYIHLTELLSKTPKRTIANYIHWCFVSKAISYTTEAMNAIWNEEVEKGTGIERNPPKWLQCVKDVKMEHAASYVFATKYFTKWTEKYVSDMIENIRQQLTLQIETANWVNEKERDLMMKRLNSIEVLIGFPDWYKNETVIKTAYKGLKVGHQHFDNMLNWDKYKIREKLRFMKEKRKEEPWDIQPILVNAVYSPYENKINVPAADFQPPLFTPELPDTVNYGIVGCIIGHEIGHAYDNNGIQFLTPDEDDLPDHLIENYFKRAECFIHQYNDYFGVTESFIEGSTPPFYEEMGSVGRRTRGENIADTTGLHAVFEAWRKLDSKKETEDIKLPGFEDYTDEQMFFIGFASAMCGVQKPEFKKMLEKYDSHSLRNIRVIGAVSNTKEFARVFSCPENSPMNPEDKCQIWKSPEETNEIPKRRRREHRRHIWSLTDW